MGTSPVAAAKRHGARVAVRHGSGDAPGGRGPGALQRLLRAALGTQAGGAPWLVHSSAVEVASRNDVMKSVKPAGNHEAKINHGSIRI